MIMNELIKKAGREIEYEERAAILEFDGGIERSEAERRAELEICNKIQRGEYRNSPQCGGEK